MVKGTPWRGPSFAPRATASSAARASAKARSSQRVTTALIFGFTTEMRRK